MANKEREELKPRDDYGREPGTGQPGNRPDEPGRSSEPGRQGQGSGSEDYPGQTDKKRPGSESEESEEESR
jgi:hypothetical protein